MPGEGEMCIRMLQDIASSVHPSSQTYIDLGGVWSRRKLHEMEYFAISEGSGLLAICAEFRRLLRSLATASTGGSSALISGETLGWWSVMGGASMLLPVKRYLELTGESNILKSIYSSNFEPDNSWTSWPDTRLRLLMNFKNGIY